MPGVWFESENEKISPHYLNAQPDCVVLLAGQRHTTPHKTIKPGIVGHALKQIHSTGTKIVWISTGRSGMLRDGFALAWGYFYIKNLTNGSQAYLRLGIDKNYQVSVEEGICEWKRLDFEGVEVIDSTTVFKIIMENESGSNFFNTWDEIDTISCILSREVWDVLQRYYKPPDYLNKTEHPLWYLSFHGYTWIYEGEQLVIYID
jgi:hypothetical protein